MPGRTPHQGIAAGSDSFLMPIQLGQKKALIALITLITLITLIALTSLITLGNIAHGRLGAAARDLYYGAGQCYIISQPLGQTHPSTLITL